MTELTTYHITPTQPQASLSFHFGRQGIGLEEAVESMPSDALFAALVAQAVYLDSRAFGDDGGPAFAQPFVHGRPPFALSSLFPRLGNLPLLPRPTLQLPQMEEGAHQQIGKGFKKLRYLSPALFADVCAGRPFEADPLIMQGGKVWLSIREAASLPKPWACMPDESPLAWQQRLKETPIWTIDEVPRVTIDRTSNASAYYEVGRVTYAAGAGLALLVQYTDVAAKKELEHLLTLLGESGLGGRRSSGYGACAWEPGPALQLELGTPGQRAVLLSRYLPSVTELEVLRSERASYQLVHVGGWVLSPGQIAQRRQRVMMVAEGSVLDVSAGPVYGQVIDVRPDYCKSMREHPIFKHGKGITHPVYRSGLALTLPIPDTEAR